MTDPIILAGMRLHQRIISQIDKNIFGAAIPLGELATYARDVSKAASSEQYCVLAFILETTLRRWQYDVAARPVSLSEMTALCEIFQQPVVVAAECLAGKGGDPIEIAAALVRAVEAGLPPLNP